MWGFILTIKKWRQNINNKKSQKKSHHIIKVRNGFAFDCVWNKFYQLAIIPSEMSPVALRKHSLPVQETPVHRLIIIIIKRGPTFPRRRDLWTLDWRERRRSWTLGCRRQGNRIHNLDPTCRAHRTWRPEQRRGYYQAALIRLLGPSSWSRRKEVTWLLR